jgi:uncharacterized membrane-anchored protein YhcB (DUF1043 family)
MEWLVPIIVAVIGGPIVVLLQQLRKENTEQHGESRALLERVADRVDKVDEKLDGHIDWHLKKEKTNGKPK